MIFPTVVTLALALAATAKPIADAGNSLLARGEYNPCDGGRGYCGWYDRGSKRAPSCKCPGGQNWNEKHHKCEYPYHPKPKCGPTQKPICARSENEWCDYDESNALCRADGTTVIIIVEIDIDITVLTPTIEEECRKPKCPHGKTLGRDGKCHYPSFPEDKAHACKQNRGKPICARNPETFCEYDTSNSLCEDDGFNSFQCVDDEEKTTDSLLTVFAGLDISLSVLGFECLRNGVGCTLNDDSFDRMCIGCDVTSFLCDLLGGLLDGLC